MEEWIKPDDKLILQDVWRNYRSPIELNITPAECDELLKSDCFCVYKFAQDNEGVHLKMLSKLLQSQIERFNIDEEEIVTRAMAVKSACRNG